MRKTDNKYQVQTVILLRNEDNSSQISQLAMMESFGLMGSSRVVDDEIQTAYSGVEEMILICEIDLNMQERKSAVFQKLAWKSYI